MGYNHYFDNCLSVYSLKPAPPFLWLNFWKRNIIFDQRTYDPNNIWLSCQTTWPSCVNYVLAVDNYINSSAYFKNIIHCQINNPPPPSHPLLPPHTDMFLVICELISKLSGSLGGDHDGVDHGIGDSLG